MGLFAFLNLEGSDVVAFAVACLIGYFAGMAVPIETLSIFTTLLVSYHLLLTWLVFCGKRRYLAPSSLVATLVTHVCCLFLLVIPVSLAKGIVPFFDFFRYAMVGLAFFERSWLFSGSEIRHQSKASVTPITTREPVKVGPVSARHLTPKQLMPKAKVARPVPAVTAIAEPQFTIVRTGRALDLWEQHMARQRPGTPEYEQWMRARRRKPATDKPEPATQ
jgi:hypothetical protein